MFPCLRLRLCRVCVRVSVLQLMSQVIAVGYVERGSGGALIPTSKGLSLIALLADVRALGIGCVCACIFVCVCVRLCECL